MHGSSDGSSDRRILYGDGNNGDPVDSSETFIEYRLTLCTSSDGESYFSGTSRDGDEFVFPCSSIILQRRLHCRHASTLCLQTVVHQQTAAAAAAADSWRHQTRCFSISTPSVGRRAGGRATPMHAPSPVTRRRLHGAVRCVRARSLVQSTNYASSWRLAATTAAGG